MKLPNLMHKNSYKFKQLVKMHKNKMKKSHILHKNTISFKKMLDFVKN